MIRISIPGKIHLIGEHSVVYGRPAILASINLYLHAGISKSSSKKISGIVQYDSAIKKMQDSIEKKIQEKVHEEITNLIAPQNEEVELIPTKKVIEEAKNLGVDFGPGDAAERIRYFIKLGPASPCHRESQV
jgi:mevalonate kinase